MEAISKKAARILRDEKYEWEVKGQVGQSEKFQYTYNGIFRG